MRCSCRVCGQWMVQSEGEQMGCVCTECGYRCRDCLGTDTVVDRSHLSMLASDPRFDPHAFEQLFEAHAFPETEDENGGY